MTTFASWSANRSTESNFAEIEEHISGCRACKTRLNRLARDCEATQVEAPSLPPLQDLFPVIPGFEFRRELGRGGMGIVYLAWQPTLERHVAIKMIPGDPLADPRARRRWLNEARAVSGLNHPNVVQIHGVDETSGRLFLILEYVPGGSLQTRLEANLPPRRAAAGLLETIARTIGHIHRRGLRHFDLKPSNILLVGQSDADWEHICPKVADFGIARRDGEPDLTATISAGPKGTPSYMAPEQVLARQGTIGPAADIYALGAILYHMLTGRPPFQTGSVLETLDQVRNQDPVLPRRIDPTIPRDLETIALKCLEKEPGSRYETAEALADDLRRCLDRESDQGSPRLRDRAGPALVSPPSLLSPRWPSRSGSPSALASLGMLVLHRDYLGQQARAATSRQAADAHQGVAYESIDQLINLARKTFDVNELPITDSPLHEACLESIRAQILDLAKKSPLDHGGQQRLARVDHLLGLAYIGRGRDEESRFLFEEEARLWERCNRRTSVTQEGLREEFDSLAALYGDFHDLRGCDEIDLLNQKLSSVVSRLASSADHADRVNLLCSFHRRHAEHLVRIGELDRAVRILGEDRRLLESLPPVEAAHPLMAMSLVLNRAASGESTGDSSLPPIAAGLLATHSRLRLDLAEHLGELMARRVGWAALAVEHRDRITGENSSTSWTVRVIARLETQCSMMGLDRRLVPKIMSKMYQFAARQCAWRRRTGRMGGSQQTADELSALAEQAVRSYPGQPESHRLLSEAHAQMAKQAWQVSDHAAVQQAWNLSLEAASRACSLDSENASLRRLVEDRRGRLARLASNP